MAICSTVVAESHEWIKVTESIGRVQILREMDRCSGACSEKEINEYELNLQIFTESQY